MHAYMNKNNKRIRINNISSSSLLNWIIEIEMVVIGATKDTSKAHSGCDWWLRNNPQLFDSGFCFSIWLLKY